MEHTISMGVDIGSTSSKCVILKNCREILAGAVIPVGAGTTGPDRAVQAALTDAGLGTDALAGVAATGYGRNSFANADKRISELSCHCRGAMFMFPTAETIIDIGGQDAKVLKVSPKTGKMLRFLMNDKCAAGTGRFLDVMSRVLDVDIADLADLAEQSTEAVEISSTCTVFAESEVISRLAGGTRIPDIVAGIHRSIASRVGGLAKRLGVAGMVVMTGGVARNHGIVAALENEIGCPITTWPDCQLAGALGAALYAADSGESRG